MPHKMQMIRGFSKEAAENGLPITYSSGLASPSFYAQPSEESRRYSETYSAVAQLGQTDIVMVKKIADLLTEHARRGHQLGVRPLGGVVEAEVQGTKLQLNAESLPRLFSLIKLLIGEPFTSLGITSAERIDLEIAPADGGKQLRGRFDTLIGVADIVGEILGEGMLMGDPDSRREVNVDIPGAMGSLPFQLFLDVTPNTPLHAHSIADIAQLIESINRDISPIQVRAFSNGVAGNLSLMSPSGDLDEDSLLEAVHAAAGYARLLPEWRNLAGSDMEWSPEIWIISPVHLAARIPLWSTGSQDHSNSWEKRLHEAVSVKLGFT